MELSISSLDKEVLAAAKQYLDERYSKWEESSKSNRAGVYSYRYSIPVSEEDGLDLMRELQKAAPEIELRGTFLSDVEGRDSSWWSSVTYVSGKDSEGRPCLYSKGSSTGWA